MPLAELLLPEFDEEMTATRRVLERVPDGKSAWKPHPKSMTLGRLATLVAELPAWTVNTLNRDAKAARDALVKTPDAEFQKPWSFKVAGRTVDTRPKYTVYRRTVLNHLAHHRGQLTVYLRLNDARVPAIFGPTADEPNF